MLPPWQCSFSYFFFGGSFLVLQEKKGRLGMFGVAVFVEDRFQEIEMILSYDSCGRAEVLGLNPKKILTELMKALLDSIFVGDVI